MVMLPGATTGATAVPPVLGLKTVWIPPWLLGKTCPDGERLPNGPTHWMSLMATGVTVSGGVEVQADTLEGGPRSPPLLLQATSTAARSAPSAVAVNRA